MMVVRDDYSGFTKAYFVHSKDDTAEYFIKYLDKHCASQSRGGEER